ncbi:MAG TPA: rRNA maturation RNase YbeY [Opitutales bacterium]|nr:rRNA maturation RNase YbeY [Opitutales bacterium]
MGTKNRRTIHLQNRSHRKLHYKPAEICELFYALDESGLFPPPKGDLSIVFLDDDQISDLHEQFLDDPEPTDVITFPGDPEMDFAGEICVSYEHALAFSNEVGTNFSHELALYLIHGYLHLVGFDDLKPEDESQMRQAESKALSFLAKSGKMPIFELRDKEPF